MTETQALAEFIRNTGPDMPPAAFRQQQAMLQQQQQQQYSNQQRDPRDQRDRGMDRENQEGGQPQKQKKRSTGFFNFGKKKNNAPENVQMGGGGGGRPDGRFGGPGGGTNAKYVKLNVPYDPFSNSDNQGGQDSRSESPQLSNREIRRSIIIAQDEGWFGAPLHGSSSRPRRPESIAYEQSVAAARAASPGFPPGQHPMSYMGGQQQFQPHPNQQQYGNRFEQGGGPQLPPGAIPPRQSFPYAPNNNQQPGMYDMDSQRGPPQNPYDRQNPMAGGRGGPPMMHGGMSDDSGSDHIHSPNDNYMGDDEDWDDENFDDEDELDEMDEELLRNTEMNAMVDLGVGDMDQPRKKPTKGPKRNVNFSPVVDELVGALIDSDGELEYGALGVSTTSLRTDEDVPYGEGPGG
ncbi:hypothetical protein HK104_007571, partial [Borealophlyctis nickersoniae]